MTDYNEKLYQTKWKSKANINNNELAQIYNKHFTLHI